VTDNPEDVLTREVVNAAASSVPARLPYTSEAIYERVHVINLPPRQWVGKELQGTFLDRERVRLLSRWCRVDFVGQRQRRGLFEPKIFRKTIATRAPFSDPWQSKSA
jgi:hypothetical protein